MTTLDTHMHAPTPVYGRSIDPTCVLQQSIRLIQKHLERRSAASLALLSLHKSNAPNQAAATHMCPCDKVRC